MEGHHAQKFTYPIREQSRRRTDNKLVTVTITRTRRARILAALASVALVAVSLVVSPQMANAASVGAGYSPGGNARNHLGSFVAPNGLLALCAQAGLSSPVGGATADAGIVGQVNGVDQTTMAKANYLVTNFGQSHDNNQAAAAAMAMWKLVDPVGYLAEAQSSGVSSGDAYVITRAPANQRPAILAKVAEIRAAVDAYSPSTTGTGSGSLIFDVDNNNYVGTVTAAVTPADARGTITLTNGIFPSTGTNTATGVAAGAKLSVRGVPPTDDGASYKISGTGSWTGGGGPGPNLHLFTTPGAQNIVGPGNSAPSVFTVSGEDPHERSQKFAPVLGTTVASKFVSKGDIPGDVVSFSTTNFVEDGRTVNNPWAQRLSGDYFQIFAEGTLFGPSATPFVQSATVPAGTAVAGHSSVMTSPQDGPNIAYEAVSDSPVVEAGYYTWVWSERFENQSASTQVFLPKDYSFTDEFGQVAETHVSPSSLTVSTKLSESVAVITGSVTDELTPSLVGGAWLQDQGKRIPVIMNGTAYYSVERPVQSTSVPENVVEIGDFEHSIDSPIPVHSAPIPVGSRPGFVSVVWSIVKANQPEKYQGYFEDWSDDYGVPAETVEVRGPTVTTEAQPVGGPGGTVQDTAIVAGLIPGSGVDITFAGYLQPVNENSAICTPDNLVFESREPVHVTKEGRYPSESFAATTDHVGRIYWVETTRLASDSRTIPSDEILSEGRCGDPAEVTDIKELEVVTVPPAGLVAGQTATDLLVVDGWVSEGTLARVFLYKQSAGAAQLVCDSATQVGDSLGPIAISAGAALNKKYASPESKRLDAGEYGFVAELVDSEGEVLYRGACHDELFTVAPVKVPALLAKTGSDVVGGGWIAAAGLCAVLAGAGIALARLKRRSSIRSTSNDSLEGLAAVIE